MIAMILSRNIARHDVQDTMLTDPTRTKRGRTKKSEKDPPKKKKEHGPPTGSLILMPFCGVTVTANKLANLPIRVVEQ